MFAISIFYALFSLSPSGHSPNLENVATADIIIIIFNNWFKTTETSLFEPQRLLWLNLLATFVKLFGRPSDASSILK